MRLELTVQRKSKKDSIQILEVGQELNFSNFTLKWEDFISNNYKIKIVCNSKNGRTIFPLGEIQLSGNPLVARIDTAQTHFPFVIGDERIDLNLFEISYKIEIVGRANNNSALH